MGTRMGQDQLEPGLQPAQPSTREDGARARSPPSLSITELEPAQYPILAGEASSQSEKLRSERMGHCPA